jgi:hypothetical protein
MKRNARIATFVNAKDFPAYIETLKKDFQASLAK